MARWLLLAIACCLGCGASAPPPKDPEPSIAPPAPKTVAKEPVPAPRAAVPLRDAPPEGGQAWETIEPEAAGFDRVAVERIIEAAAATQSSSLLIMKDGKVMVERYFGQPHRPIETMSATKSVVSIAVGMLIDDGKIKSIDEPLSVWYPEFRRGKKKQVTLRHVLTHSSGLSHGMGAGAMNKEKDRLKYARKREVTSDPGAVFSYNNEATQLLSGVIAKAAGKPVDAYLDERLFKPLAITQWEWDRDKAGNVQTFYGLALHARDFAKIGQLLLDDGAHAGAQLVSRDWARESTRPAKPVDYHGYLWWVRYRQGNIAVTGERLTALGAKGFSAVAKLEPLRDARYPASAEREAFWLDAGARLDERERQDLAALAREGVVAYEVEKGKGFGFAADGWLGQQLLVVPAQRVVVVRQHEAPEGVMADDAYNQRVGYFKLARDVELAFDAKGKPAK